MQRQGMSNTLKFHGKHLVPYQSTRLLSNVPSLLPRH